MFDHSFIDEHDDALVHALEPRLITLGGQIDSYGATRELHRLSQDALAHGGSIDTELSLVPREQRKAERQAYLDLKTALDGASPAQAVLLLQNHLAGLCITSTYYEQVATRLRIAMRALQREQQQAALDERRARLKALRERGGSPLQRAIGEQEFRRAEILSTTQQELADIRLEHEQRRLWLLEYHEPQVMLIERDEPQLLVMDDVERLVLVEPIRSPPTVHAPMDSTAVSIPTSEQKQAASAFLKFTFMHTYRRAHDVTGIHSNPDADGTGPDGSSL